MGQKARGQLFELLVPSWLLLLERHWAVIRNGVDYNDNEVIKSGNLTRTDQNFQQTCKTIMNEFVQ